MTYTFKLSRRIARLRVPGCAALLLMLAACNGEDGLAPSSANPTSIENSTPSFASSFAGGIPFGTFEQPNEVFGSRYNGAMRIIGPTLLLSDLAAIKARGGRVVVNLAGGQRTFKDADGHFSLTLWKRRVDRFKGIDFSSYLEDGTIVAHYLVDEPNDPSNWNGVPISGATIDQMAQYSKQLWPKMPTVVRAYPDYLAKWTGTYQYLDAAWAQYVYRKGPADEFITRSVSDAKSKGLGLVVGLNILRGGPDGAAMTASQVQNWGSALLSSSYPCAFISWEYDSDYLGGGAIQDAMDALRAKAQNRSTASCRGGSTTETAPPPTSDPAPSPSLGGTLPFGVALTPSAEYSDAWTGTLYRASTSAIRSTLDRAAGRSMNVAVMLVSKSQASNADRTFSLTRWKAAVDRYRTLSLGGYISDGTMYLHYLVEQPNCASCWGGKPIPWETVEEMARYSKSIWPALPTAVRVAPSILAGAQFQWTYLDAGWMQYNTRQGDLQTVLATQVAKAKQEGLGLVAGLNLEAAGGYGTGAMTAAQIERFGTILAKEPSVCALVGWKYKATYLDQSAIRSALDSVAAVARRRTPASCVVN